MKHSEALDKIAPALVRARQSMGPVHKDQTNTFFSNKYATLGAIVAAALPALLAEGIMVIQGGGSADEVGAEVLTRLQHDSGQYIETSIWLPILGQKIKGGGFEPISPQSAGSLNSYGRRYGLAAALSIVADEDDDGNAASRPAKPQRPLPPGVTKEQQEELAGLAASPMWTDEERTALLKRGAAMKTQEGMVSFLAKGIAEVVKRTGGASE